MQFLIRLSWERPADGVDIVVDEDLAQRSFWKGDRRVARMRSAKSVPVTHQLTNLEDPIVLRFINCRDDKERASFLGNFGFLHHGEETSMSEFRYGQEILKSKLPIPNQLGIRKAEYPITYNIAEMGLWYGISFNPPAFEKPSAGQALLPVLQPDSLVSYMGMEIAYALQVGAVATTCQHCGKFVLTGSMTGRRSHAKYCSDKCRVAAMRKRNAAKGKA